MVVAAVSSAVVSTAAVVSAVVSAALRVKKKERERKYEKVEEGEQRNKEISFGVARWDLERETKRVTAFEGRKEERAHLSWQPTQEW